MKSTLRSILLLSLFAVGGSACHQMEAPMEIIWVNSLFEDSPDNNNYGIDTLYLGLKTKTRSKIGMDKPKRVRWDKAMFHSPDYSDSIKIRPLIQHRGSFKLRFPKNNFYAGKYFLFLKPARVSLLTDLYCQHIARSMGMPVPQKTLYYLVINGQHQGLYYLEEKPDEYFLETNSISSSFVFEDCYDVNDPVCLHVVAKDSLTQMVVSEKLGLVYRQTANGEGFDLQSLFDLDYVADYLLLKLLEGRDFYQESVAFYYANTNGKIYPIYESSPVENQVLTPADRDIRVNIFSLLIADEGFQKVWRSKVEEWSFNLLSYKQALQTMEERYLEPILQHDRNSGHPSREYALQQLTGLLERSENLDDPESLNLDAGLLFPESLLHLPWGDSAYASFHRQSTDELIRELMTTYDLERREDTLIFPPGTRYRLEKDMVIPAGYLVFISAGVRMKLGAGVNLLSYSPIHISGTQYRPVTITAIDCDQPFGTVAYVGDETKVCHLSWLDLSCGYESRIHGMYLSGALCLYHSDVSMTKCRIYNNKADDGLNIKYGSINLYGCSFFQNYADQVDLDFCRGEVIDCIFDNNKGDSNGDGLDFSGSEVTVRGCTFNNFDDKGISIGEKSTIRLAQSAFRENNLGIAIKDLSVLTMDSCRFDRNKKAISLYRKKQIFGGGTLREGPGNQYMDNDTLFVKDSLSTIRRDSLMGI